jgi:hypothetical protein
MRPPTPAYQAATGDEVILQAIAAQLKVCFDAYPKPPSDNIDVLIQRLIALEIERESGKPH